MKVFVGRISNGYGILGILAAVAVPKMTHVLARTNERAEKTTRPNMGWM